MANIIKYCILNDKMDECFKMLNPLLIEELKQRYIIDSFNGLYT